jgi:hypothetical protein
LGHLRASGYCSQGERLHSGRDPNCSLQSEKSLARNRESRSREDAGRRNYPEAVPKKMRGGNGRWIESSNLRSGRPELRAAAYGTIGLEVALEERMAVKRDRRLVRALSAESPPRGGPLMSQLGSAGQSARVRPGHRWLCAENSENKQACRGHESKSQMAG